MRTNRHNQYTNDTLNCVLSLAGILAFLAAVATFGSGCSTTRTVRNTAAGTVTTSQRSYAGIVNDTEIVEQSRTQYTECLEARRAQGFMVWADNQLVCFQQTTLGQGIGGLYGFGSPAFNGYMNFWGQNFVPGWNIPMGTGNPNVVMANGRPVLIPVGANVNQGWASPQTAYATMAMDDLVRRAGVANQTTWAVAASQPAPVVAQPTATPAPSFSVTREQWDALMRQVATLSARRTR